MKYYFVYLISQNYETYEKCSIVHKSVIYYYFDYLNIMAFEYL